jgi:hypothetical protein
VPGERGAGVEIGGTTLHVMRALRLGWVGLLLSVALNEVASELVPQWVGRPAEPAPSSAFQANHITTLQESRAIGKDRSHWC